MTERASGNSRSIGEPVIQAVHRQAEGRPHTGSYGDAPDNAARCRLGAGEPGGSFQTLSETTAGQKPAEAALEPTPGGAGGALTEGMSVRVGSLWSDAWYDLRRDPVFLISVGMIAALLTIAAFPGLFTSRDPHAPGFCTLENFLRPPDSAHWFGFDTQGCDVYTRTIWGTRNSIVVGVSTTLLVAWLGGILGMVAGYYGGPVDAVIARVTDVFFAIPLILGGLLVLSLVGTGGVWTVALIMAVLGWPPMFRLMRSSVISTKQSDYVVAARALGAGDRRVLLSHVLPNAVVPVIVVSTLNLGAYIAAEAALSFLGIGVQPPAISWGLMIDDAQQRFLDAPHALLFPAAFLSVTVLSFIMFGDAIRDALDPKLR